MHWHIINWNESLGVIGVLKYNNPSKSIVDFLDICYKVFDAELDESDRTMYETAMLDFSEDDAEAELLGRRVRTHLSHTTEKLNISWVSCDEEPCSFAIYN